MKNFRDLKVWRKAHELTLEVDQATMAFPVEEKYGLRAELRRTARSVAFNIAEGCAKDTDADFRRFVVIATGSASELEYGVLLAADLRYLEATDHEPMNGAVTEVKRMLTSLAQKLKADS